MNIILGPLLFILICIFLALFQKVNIPSGKKRPRVLSADIVDGKLRNVKYRGQKNG